MCPMSLCVLSDLETVCNDLGINKLFQLKYRFLFVIVDVICMQNI